MRRLLFIVALILCQTFAVSAQNDKDSFDSYRKKMLSGFQGFRKSIFDDYEKFLNGIWKDYEVFKGEKWSPLPKPGRQPVKEKDKPAPPPKAVEPESIKPIDPPTQNEPPQQKPVVPNPQNLISFDWCGMTLQLPDAKITGELKSISKEAIVAFFEVLDNSRLDNDVLPQMVTLAKASNFNDWCLYLMVDSYVKKLKANSNINTRNFICWYIMAGFGFDARLGSNGKNIFYLLPFQQKVYGHNYMLIHDTPYYVWGEGNIDSQDHISTPELPEDAGNYINLVLLKPLNIPYRAKQYSRSFSGCTLTGSINENLIKVMRKFPQMPIPCYAISEGDPKARGQVLDQMGKFIYGMTELEAANFILQFIQSFDYATDEEQFGYEKPFFIEETLYYPKCDCEDRAIFYHYLVTNLIKKDVHLVHYPNHECNAVNFSQKLNADSYTYQGKQYVICDPTYIGASIGMCMPDFKNTRPEVELIK